MLDPTLPWLSHGYKKAKDDFSQKFLSDVDYKKNTDTSSENRLRISTPKKDQQERVKSATIRRVQDGRSGSARSRDSGGDTYLFLRESRPRSAYSLYSVKSFMSGPPQVKNKRARSATVRRKAADLQKSFTHVERTYEEERLDRNFRKLARPRTAQGLVRGRPNVTWSGDWRPTSSTGLIPTTPFDRYVSYERPRSARRSHSPLKENDVRRGDTPQFFDISKRAWLHDRPPQSPPRSPPPPQRIRTPVRIVRTPSNVSAKAGSGEPSTVEMSPPPSLPAEEEIPVEEEEEEEEGDWQEQIEVSVQMKEPEPPPPSPTPEPPEEPELAWDEEEKEEEEQPKPPSPPPTPPREPTPPPREPTPPPREATPPPREPTPPPREPTPPPREPTPPPREPTPPPEPEKEPTPPPSPPPVEKTPTPTPPLPPPEVEEEPVEVAPPLVEEEPPPPTPSPEPVVEEPPPEVEEPPTMEEEEAEPEPEPEPEPVPEPVEVKEVKIEEVEVVEPPRTPAEKSDEEMEEPATEAPPEEEDGKKGRKKSAKGKKKKKRKAPPKVEKTPVPALMMDPSEILNMEMKMRRKNLLENKAENDAIVAEVQEFEVKRPKQQAWLQGRLALSRQISRFELPMDMRLLEGMSPIEYLSNYCIVSKRRQNLYKQSFSKADRDRDGVINVKELDKALKQIHVDGVTTEQVQKILDVIQATDDTKFDAKLFTAVCALAERMLYTYFVTEDTDDIMYSQKERVEDADFCALEWKLHGVKVNPPIRKLLQML